MSTEPMADPLTETISPQRPTEVSVAKAPGLRGVGKGVVFLALLLSLGLGACQRVGVPRPGEPPPPEPPPAPETPTPREAPDPPPPGLFRGTLYIEGGRVPATLELTQEGGDRIRGLLASGMDLTARGEGRIRRGQVRLELSYEEPCPGVLVLRGYWDPESGVFTGNLRARDCTGEAQGTFELRWRGT